MDSTYRPLFKGAIATTTTKYIHAPIHKGHMGLHIAWLDATTAATITIELSSFGPLDAPHDTAGSAWEWVDSGEEFTGPSGSAAGALLVNFENVRQRRARIKIVTTAASEFEIYEGNTL